MYRSILIAADGSDNSFRAAKEAVKLASLVKGAEVTIIYVIDHNEAGNEEIHRHASAEIEMSRQKKILPIIELLEKEMVFHKVEMIYGVPVHVIAEYANDRNFDILIMGKRGLNPMQEMVLGSVSRSVLNKVDMPVLIVK
ncbi:universal stress protein [Planomicrobium okeanokoites]|uniref:universal stress protein n=1 Tax=Planomicrobium okeanokoites TaxID=244 RepID=UPI0024928F11|nr:universal stress protein [Planomicrobium okeanokoites]